jgi:hypothetical protein
LVFAIFVLRAGNGVLRIFRVPGLLELLPVILDDLEDLRVDIL